MSRSRCGKLRSRHCSCSGDCKLGAAATRNLFSNCFSGFTCLARCGIASEKCYIFRSFPFFCASCGTLQWRLQTRCRQPKPVFKMPKWVYLSGGMWHCIRKMHFTDRYEMKKGGKTFTLEIGKCWLSASSSRMLKSQCFPKTAMFWRRKKSKLDPLYCASLIR